MIQEDLNPDFSSILMKESNLFNKSNTDNMLDNLDDDKE
jgi:hypothetical protein